MCHDPKFATVKELPTRLLAIAEEGARREKERSRSERRRLDPRYRALQFLRNRGAVIRQTKFGEE